MEKERVLEMNVRGIQERERLLIHPYSSSVGQLQLLRVGKGSREEKKRWWEEGGKISILFSLLEVAHIFYDCMFSCI